MLDYKFDEFKTIKVTNRFKSKSEALKQKVIYVYCPAGMENTIGQIVDDYTFDMVVNDYSITNLDKKVICHYNSSDLSKEQRKFLVVATELGAWVEPLVSYLDLRLGYTEVKLLQSSYFLHQKAFSILSTKRTQYAKRAVDIFSALLLSIVALQHLVYG